MQFRKKPVVIEAVRWSGTRCESDPPKWWLDAIDIGEGRPGGISKEDGELHIFTLEGIMRADPGDYVIQGVKGEIYPCKPDIFKATYEAV